MKRRRFAPLPVALLVLGLGIPLGRAEAAQKLKVTMPAVSIAIRPVYLAKGRGYFAEEGLDVDVRCVRLTQDVLQQAGLLNRRIPFAEVATNDFLPNEKMS